MPAASHRTDNRQTVSAGFTLLELLVVVGISGILMALLLPALSHAKEKSRRCVCKQNQEEDLTAIHYYAGDNDDFLPSAADDQGNYHAIILSDFTFGKLASYLGGVTNCLYCPNLTYDTGQMGGYQKNVGYTIGYGYLATNGLVFSTKGPFDWVSLQKTTDTTGAVFADANYWTGSLTVAPHGAGGSTVTVRPSVTIPGMQPAATAASINSGQAGALGGNEGFIDGHVEWRSIHSMATYPASSDGLAYGSW